ncbi:MAG TPA: DNA-3-methyladenine glycosylase [Candidatus Bathyarchaeia archaeon]|nr:DNA-3-methyladenine glycosylase [Candidatus Bathyarchaeia archaeon]
MKFFIKPKSPFDFDLVASLYSRFPVQCVDLYEKGTYRRVLAVDGKYCLIEVTSVGSVKLPKLAVKVSPPVGKERFIKEKVKWLVGADEDVLKFYWLASGKKNFKRLIDELYGLRAPKTATVFEALIIAITEQQIALPVAIALRKRLVEKYGNSIKTNHKDYFAFPTPEQLAKAQSEEVRQLKFSSRKADYLINVSRKVAAGEIDLEAMKNWPVEKVLDVLTRIKGIGPWTVEYMMCRGMGRYDALPAGDMGLRAAVTKYLGKKERVSEKEVRKLLKPFGKYQGKAAFYLIYSYAFQKYPQERLL